MGTVTKYDHAFNDTAPMGKDYFSSLYRVSKNQIIFGANHFIDNLPEPRNSPCWLVWDKVNNGYFADCELAWTSFTSAIRLFRFAWNGMLQGDMKNKEKRIHPTQKPKALYGWIYNKYAKPGFKILDTHMGSGSSRLAAYDANLEYVGFEIDKYYFDKQEERWADYIAQVRFEFEGGTES